MKSEVTAPLVWIFFVYVIAHGYINGIIQSLYTAVNYDSKSIPNPFNAPAFTIPIIGLGITNPFSPIVVGKGSDLAISDFNTVPLVTLGGTLTGGPSAKVRTFVPSDKRIAPFTCDPNYTNACIIPTAPLQELQKLGLIPK